MDGTTSATMAMAMGMAATSPKPTPPAPPSTTNNNATSNKEGSHVVSVTGGGVGAKPAPTVVPARGAVNGAGAQPPPGGGVVFPTVALPTFVGGTGTPAGSTTPPLVGLERKRSSRSGSFHRRGSIGNLSASGCSNAAATLKLEGVAMQVPYRVHVVAADEDRKVVQALVDGVFSDVKVTFSHFVSSSEVSRFNAMPVGKACVMSRDMRDVLRCVVDLHGATNGLFDPTVGALSALWMASLSDSEAAPDPEDPAIRRAQAYVGFSKHVKVGFAEGTLTKVAQTQLDLCGVAKGFCVDRIVQVLGRRGFGDVYVDWGGDVRVAGAHPSGRPWRCGVVKPPPLASLYRTWSMRGDGGLSRSQSMSQGPGADDASPTTPAPEDAHAARGVSVHPKDDRIAHCEDLPHDTAVATSGDYRTLRKFGYHHLLCPTQLAPMRASAASTASVTVFHARCMVADAVATYLMLLQDPARIEAWVREHNAAASTADDRIRNYIIFVRGREEPITMRDAAANADPSCGVAMTPQARGTAGVPVTSPPTAACADVTAGSAVAVAAAAPVADATTAPAVDTVALRELMRAAPQPVSLVVVPDTRGGANEGCHIITASSAVPLCVGGVEVSGVHTSRFGAFYFNVMGGSLLNTLLRVGGSVTLHLLRGSDVDYAQMFAKSAYLPYGDVSALPGAVGGIGVSAEYLPFDPSERRAWCTADGYAQILQLNATAHPCVVTGLRTAGDHTMVIAEYLRPRAIAPPSILLYQQRAYLACRSHGECFAHRVVVTSRGVREPVGVVGVNPGTLSVQPPILAFVLEDTPLTAAFFEKGSAMRLHLLAKVDGPRRMDPAHWFAAADGQWDNHPEPGTIGGGDVLLPHSLGHIDLDREGAMHCHDADDARRRCRGGRLVVHARVAAAVRYPAPARGTPQPQLFVGAQLAMLTPTGGAQASAA